MPENFDIEKLRPPKNKVNPEIPYHFLHEQECGPQGNLQEVNTIFLTAKECSFRCTMCDLWKNTLNAPTPVGAILKQIDYALARLPNAEVIKLYNSGNFFDQKAIPPTDYPGIIQRLQSYNRVIIENHPSLSSKACVEFNEKLKGTLEIAMGLETIHPEVLPKLNKRLSKEDFKKAAGFLRGNEIDVRAFILLNPPFLKGRKENIEWTFKTLEFAFECGATCCSIIPVRAGNGIMDVFLKEGEYEPPTLDAFEEVFDRALNLKKGRVFVDTWDIQFLSDCTYCFEVRKNRLEKMNLEQKIYSRIECHCN